MGAVSVLRNFTNRDRCCLVFDYLYRDAGNYKRFGSVHLLGILTDVEKTEVIACLDGGEFFVAEQVGIPPLYFSAEDSGGPNEDDHAWHAFDGFREEESTAEIAGQIVESSDFISTFRASKGNWQPEMSPNFRGAH